MDTEYNIFCDLDGVLANFDKRVIEITGKHPHDLGKKEMWRTLANAEDFFYSLELMPDGEELWDYIKEYEPTILTGLPHGKWAKGQKIRWVGEKFGWQVPVIAVVGQTTKALYSGEGHILIDDRDKVKPYWENEGGIFIHHKNTRDTLAQLKELGL